ncbi:MAG: hypothetical protein AAFV95_10230 [Bacteroidota bacterium]
MDKNIELKKPPILYRETQTIIQDIQKEIDGDFLSYWISENSQLVQEDVLAMYKILNGSIKHKTLYLFVKSEGGSGKGALRIVHLLRNFYSNIVALIPLDCASAATMLVLGADSIQMGPLAYLSAIDTSITHELSPIDDKFNDKVSVSQNELDRVLKLWDAKRQASDTNPYKELYHYIHPLVFGSVDRASSLSIKLTTEILSYHLKDEQKARHISNHLNSEYPSHSYPITIREAKQIGLKVTAMDLQLNDRLLQLNELYSEMAQNAQTDYDQMNHHDNGILKIVERMGNQIFYQKEKDWHYLSEERRYISLNEESSWRTVADKEGELEVKNFYIR